MTHLYIDKDLAEIRAKLLGSFLSFTQFFFTARTGKEFTLSQPVGRESHFISLAKSLTLVFRGQTQNIVINIPPRFGKTEMLIHFVAWTLAHYPDSQYIYVSYSHSLAAKQTHIIKQIVQLPIYKRLFGVEIRPDSTAKDNFETTAGGTIYAAGAGGTITGRGAGLRDGSRWGGAIVIDDIIKPSEATSDTIRCAANDWFNNTLQSRVNSAATPIIFIGQRTHEDDPPKHLLDNGFTPFILPAIDRAGNALYPEYLPLNRLKDMEDKSPYEFSAQYQQDPQPAGGGIFKPDRFVLLDEEPNILSTFLTVDSAETDKNYNDATVFSFWGLYQIQDYETQTDIFALHWLDCAELRIEPKDLEGEFLAFYNECCRHKIKPSLIAIEKKSTGVTLSSILSTYRGLNVHQIDANRSNGSKTQRFLEIQSIINKRLISFSKEAKHAELCVEHCRKITANNSHRHDDIADTMYYAIKIGLIENIIKHRHETSNNTDRIVAQLAKTNHNVNTLRKNAYRAHNPWQMR